jgi:hypothetical protein
MITKICEGKINFAKQLQAEKARELNKRLLINARENAETKKLRALQQQVKDLENGKAENLEAQFEYLGKKVTSKTDGNKPVGLKDITVHEALAMEGLWWLVQELAKTRDGTLNPDFTRYYNNLNQWIDSRNTVMKTYDV